MLNTMNSAYVVKPHRGNSQPLCEAIYRRLNEWVPMLRQLPNVCVTRDWDPYYQIQFMISEHTPYCSFVEIRLMTNDGAKIPAARFSVRLYHDAQVAEVVGYQGHRNLRPLYDIPNVSMYARDEKRQINRLFFEFLNLCLRRQVYLDFSVASA